jgi:glycosyltransferase involved in cell wall biosynthesis
VASITVITPCFNEELNLRECVVKVKEALSSHDLEHIFIDNASLDNSVAELIKLKNEFVHLKILQNSQNVGAFSSIQRALSHVSTEWVVPFYAADLQDPPNVLSEMMSVQEKTDCDSVFGVRATRDEKKWLFAFRRLFYKILNYASNKSYVNGTSEFCLIRSENAKKIGLIRDSNPFLRIYLSQLKGKAEYVPYKMEPRKEGKSSANIFTLFDDALNAFSIILPSVFSRMLVVSIVGSFIGLAVTTYSLLDIMILPFNLERLLTPGIVILCFSVIIGINSIIGHYAYLIHLQVRNKLEILTVERKI